MSGATDGNIEVTDSEGTAVSAKNFDVTPSPVPTITSFAPTIGPAGTTVVITGTGLTGVSSVTFNDPPRRGVPPIADPRSVPSSWVEDERSAPFVESGLLLESDGALVPTERGMLVLNELVLALVG